MRDIGKNIKALRQQKNLTQDELAEKLFVTRQTVSNYETGKSRPDVEMLTKIAETLDTDPNTVLYGLPQQVNREKMILKLCIYGAVLVVTWINFAHLAKLGQELAAQKYEMGLSIFCRIFGIPVVAFLFGWTAMQALGTFAKLSPMPNPWSKRLRWITAITAICYLLMLVPVVAAFILRSDFGSFLPDFLWNPWSYAAMWVTGYIHGMILRPNLLLFGILGCAFWLSVPQKTKE